MSVIGYYDKNRVEVNVKTMIEKAWEMMEKYNGIQKENEGASVDISTISNDMGEIIGVPGGVDRQTMRREDFHYYIKKEIEI